MVLFCGGDGGGVVEVMVMVMIFDGVRGRECVCGRLWNMVHDASCGLCVCTYIDNAPTNYLLLRRAGFPRGIYYV